MLTEPEWLDGKVTGMPMVRNRIIGGILTIEGPFTAKDVKKLAEALKKGMPAKNEDGGGG